MATVIELRNEAAEALQKAKEIAESGGTEEAYNNAWADYERRSKAYRRANDIAEQEKTLGMTDAQASKRADDMRNPDDAAQIRPVSADVANANPSGFVKVNDVIFPIATSKTEGWVKGRAVALQHPDILKRLGPEQRAEKAKQEEAFAYYFRNGLSNLRARRPELLPFLNALQEDTDSEGGYFVPIDQRFEVIRDPSYPAGVLRQRSTVFTTTRDGGHWPTTTTVTWAGIAEEATNSDSDPVQGQVPFTIRKSGVNNRLSIELLGDSAVPIPALLGVLYSESKGRYEDQQGIEGDGSTEPLGLRGTGSGATQGAISAVTDLWTLAAPTALNVINSFFNLPAQYRANGKYFMTSSLMARVWAIGSAAAGIHLIGDDAGLSAPVGMNPDGSIVLFGKEVFFYDGTGWDDAATISANEVIGAFGDFSQYYFIDRMGMSVQRDDSVYFATDQVAFKARVRYDSLFAVANAFRLLKGAAS